MSTQLPEWIEELAENWRQAARTESERAFWNEQLKELKNSFDQERVENERTRRAIEEEARKAVAQSAHASLAARRAEELIEENVTLRGAQEKARDQAVEAAKEASSSADVVQAVLTEFKHRATRVLADQGEAVEESRRAAETARSVQDEIAVIADDLRSGLEQVADETRSELAARTGAALSALEHGLTVLDESVAAATRDTAKAAAGGTQHIRTAIEHARAELSEAVGRARNEAARAASEQAQASVAKARAELSETVSEGKARVEGFTTEALSKAEGALQEAQATAFVVTQQAVNTGESVKESIEAAADRALSSVTRVVEISEQAESSVRIAVEGSKASADRASLEAQEKIAKLVSEAVARTTEETSHIKLGAQDEIHTVVEAARVACLDAVMQVRRESKVASEEARSNVDRARESIGKEVAGAVGAVEELVSDARERLAHGSETTLNEISLASDRAERLAAKAAREAASTAAQEHAELARAEIDAGRADIQRTTTDAVERIVEVAESKQASVLSLVNEVGEEITARVADGARQAEDAAERAAKEAAAGAVSLEAQKEAALSAARSAKAADAALEAAQKEAEARIAQEQAAASAEASANASRETAEAAREALTRSIQQIEEALAEREDALRSFEEARGLIEATLAKMDYTLTEMTDMIARFGVAQAKVLEEQNATLSETQVAARAAQGAARAAQASSVAAQKDATRALRAVVAFAERDEGENAVIRLDDNGHDGSHNGEILTPWDELTEEDDVSLEQLWSPADGNGDNDHPDLYGDEEPPLFERILTKFRPERDE